MDKRRPETGPMQFGDDWTGIFIRGDNAFYYQMALDSILSNEEILKAITDLGVLMPLMDLCDLLAGANHQNESRPMPQQAVLSGKGYKWCPERLMLVPINPPLDSD